MTQLLADDTHDAVLVLQHDLTRRPMTVDDLFLVPIVVDAAAPYAVCHVIEIANEVNRVHFAVAELAQHEGNRLGRNAVIPSVQEFYVVLGNNRRYHLRKRKWP